VIAENLLRWSDLSLAEVVFSYATQLTLTHPSTIRLTKYQRTLPN
jgi:hypothetical protein